VTTTDNSALKQRFLTLLVTETQQLLSFVSVLEQERETLKQENVEALIELAANKAGVARQLQHLAHNRAAVLAQAGLPHSREGIERLLAGQYADIWQKYLELASEARTLNQDNSLTVSQRLAANHQALATLLAYSDQPMVYGPDGASRTRPGSRHLGSV
jgi:flagellar biosynthesis/type III secretory pathway chaperone